MRRSAKAVEEDDLATVGTTKLRKLCHRMVWPTGVGAQEAEVPERNFCDRPKFINRVVVAN